jgi:hypothetical protein
MRSPDKVALKCTQFGTCLSIEIALLHKGVGSLLKSSMFAVKLKIKLPYTHQEGKWGIGGIAPLSSSIIKEMPGSVASGTPCIMITFI